MGRGAEAPRLVFSGIYALIEPRAHEDVVAFTEAVVDGGVAVVQVRAKGEVRADLIRSLHALTRRRNVPLIVNDDIEAGLLADGVHLGVEDCEGHDLRALRERYAGKILGLSCGTPDEARAARAAGADYLGVGPIFASPTKSDAGPPIGVSGVRAVVEAVDLPVVAIGGIALASIPRVRESGAAMAAVLSALSPSTDPRRDAAALVAAWHV